MIPKNPKNKLQSCLAAPESDTDGDTFEELEILNSKTPYKNQKLMGSLWKVTHAKHLEFQTFGVRLKK